MIGLIGKKVGMTRLFGQEGESIPVTAILAGPCHVVQIKTQEKEGYRSVQLGAFNRRKNLVKKPQRGHYAKAGVEPKARLAEFRVANIDLYHTGQQIRVDIFQKGDRVKVTGTSKGRGFAGGVKRWGFAGGPKSHGQSDRHRAPGSLGGSSYPSRVWKGLKMAGHMGSERVTVSNLEVVKVDLDRNLLLIRGAVPGARNGYLLIQRTTELMALPPPPEEEPEKAAVTRDETQEASASEAQESQAPVSAEKKTSQKVPSSKKEKVEGSQEASPEKPEEIKLKGKAGQKDSSRADEPKNVAASAQKADTDVSERTDAPSAEAKPGEEEGKTDG